MSKLFLPPEDIEELQNIASSHSDPRTRRQAKAILSLFEGKQTKQEIADSIGMTRSGLFRLQKRFEEHGGIVYFAEQSKVGRPPKITEEYRKELELALQSNPKALGLSKQFDWSAEILLDYMTEKTGLKLSIWTLRNLLHKMGYTYEWHKVVVISLGREQKRTLLTWNKDDSKLEDRYARP